jgi:SAM-dependent methyltransferase
MANFPPLKNYILYCLNHLIDQYELTWPFLDVGCGTADVSRHLALKGWQGKAIDFSDIAIEKARENLAAFRSSIELEKKSLFRETGTFKTIFFMDVLEHIEDDIAALNKLYSLLAMDGHLVISTISNPKEWRWDDDLYGHYRRYTIEEIKRKLIDARLEPLVCWDFTYPVFWIMRRVYTSLKSFPGNIEPNKHVRSMASSAYNAWDMPPCSIFLSRKFILWDLVYKIQFKYFKNKLSNGHEMIILAKKRA